MKFLSKFALFISAASAKLSFLDSFSALMNFIPYHAMTEVPEEGIKHRLRSACVTILNTLNLKASSKHCTASKYYDNLGSRRVRGRVLQGSGPECDTGTRRQDFSFTCYAI